MGRTAGFPGTRCSETATGETTAARPVARLMGWRRTGARAERKSVQRESAGLRRRNALSTSGLFDDRTPPKSNGFPSCAGLCGGRTCDPSRSEILRFAQDDTPHPNPLPQRGEGMQIKRAHSRAPLQRKKTVSEPVPTSFPARFARGGPARPRRSSRRPSPRGPGAPCSALPR